jgi:predicted RNase H-like HicB family nuclease
LPDLKGKKLAKDLAFLVDLCYTMQGRYTQGDTYNEVVANIKDAIKLHIQDRLESGEPIIELEKGTLATVEVMV